MATTCSFGQIKDGRFRSICVNGKEIINNNRDLKCIRCFNSNTACFRKYLVTDELTEKKDGLVTDKVIYFNPHGYGRINLNCNLNYEYDFNSEEELDEILYPDCWETTYETKYPQTLLLRDGNEGAVEHHFTVPSELEYKNPCLENWCALVEVCIQLKIDTEFTEDLQFCIKKNDETVVTSNCIASGYDYDFEDGNIKTVKLVDIIECNPSDTLDIYIKLSFGKVDIISGSENSYANFKIIGFQECSAV